MKNHEKYTMTNRVRGLYISESKASSVKKLLHTMYTSSLDEIVCEEGLSGPEAEEMAIQGVTEVLREFFDSVGFEHRIDLT